MGRRSFDGQPLAWTAAVRSLQRSLILPGMAEVPGFFAGMGSLIPWEPRSGDSQNLVPAGFSVRQGIDYGLLGLIDLVGEPAFKRRLTSSLTDQVQ